MTTVAQLWVETTAIIGDRIHARWIVERATAVDSVEDGGADSVTERMMAHLDQMVRRYQSGEPIQYVLGQWAFRHVELAVDPRVLIPRPETEEVAGVALEIASRFEPRRVLDLGTGSGAIGLALASELPLEGTEIWITDVDAGALDVARSNLAGLGRHARNVRVAAGSWFGAITPSDQFDVIVSNPPYIAEDDPEVEVGVEQYEPHRALYSGADGLDAIRLISAGAPRHLVPGGSLVLEIGHRQGTAVKQLLIDAGFENVEIRRDLAGRDRIAVGSLG
jgi:release factor glutamine methyltransferase